MSTYATLGGGYVGLQPGTTAVYHNRMAGGWWEELAVTKRGEWYDVDFVAAGKPLRLNEQTHQLETGTHHDGWGGQWDLSDDGREATCADVVLTLYGYTPPLQPLRISGRDFVTETGARRVLKGCDAFMAYRHFLDGGAAALVPFVEESRALGFDLWRVFLMGSKAQNQVMDLRPSEAGYYDRLRPFAATLNANGITILATAFVDAQDVMPNQSQRQQHWKDVADRLRNTVTLLSGGNEWQKNGFNPGELSDPGMLWSRGSDLGDSAPYRPYGSFAEFHPRRDLWASLMDTVASPVFIYETNGLSGPLIIDEPPKMGTNGSSGFTEPSMARRYAQHLSAECAGAVFHNWFGQRGLLMDGHTRTCADAWQRGMAI